MPSISSHKRSNDTEHTTPLGSSPKMQNRGEELVTKNGLANLLRDLRTDLGAMVSESQKNIVDAASHKFEQVIGKYDKGVQHQFEKVDKRFDAVSKQFGLVSQDMQSLRSSEERREKQMQEVLK